MRKVFKLLIYSIFLLLIAGCENEAANLTISNIDFAESYRNVALDLPNGTYVPDNPDFDINNPETWTGNMAHYVNHNFLYSVSYNVKNIGDNIAYDAEIDLHFIYDDDSENVETIYIGDINPDERISKSSGTGCTNKQLINCWAEVFWFDN